MAHATRQARAAYARKWRARRRAAEAAAAPCARCGMSDVGRDLRLRMGNLGSALCALGLRRAAGEGRGLALAPGDVAALWAIFEDRFQNRPPGV